MTKPLLLGLALSVTLGACGGARPAQPGPQQQQLPHHPPHVMAQPAQPLGGGVHIGVGGKP